MFGKYDIYETLVPNFDKRDFFSIHKVTTVGTCIFIVLFTRYFIIVKYILRLLCYLYIEIYYFFRIKIPLGKCYQIGMSF